MFLQQTQWDSNSRPRALNGSFLVLNLGANTVELGDSCRFLSHPLEKNTSTGSNCKGEKNCNPEAASDSVNDVPHTIKDKCKTKVSAMGTEDQEHTSKGKMEDNNARRKRTLSHQSAKKSSERVESYTPSKASSRTDESRRDTTQSSDLSRPLSQNNATCISPLPQYFVNLLNFFGWRVEFRYGFGDLVYISPQGEPCRSLPKIFDIFLHGNARCKGKEWGSWQFASNGSLNRNSLQEIPGKVNFQGGNSSKGKVRKKRESKKKNVLTAEGCLPNVSRATHEKDIDSNASLPGKTIGTRRSSRLSCKHSAAETKVDWEVEANYSCFFTPEEIEEEPTTSTSDSEFILDEDSDTSTDDKYPKPRVKRPGKRELAALNLDPRSNSVSQLEAETCEHGKANDGGSDQILADNISNAERVPESSHLVLSTILVNDAVKIENKKEPLVTISDVGNAKDDKGKPHCSMPSPDNKVEVLDLSSEFPCLAGDIEMKQPDTIKISEQVAQKDDTMDWNFNIDMGFDEDYPDHSKYVVDGLVTRNNEKVTILSSGKAGLTMMANMEPTDTISKLTPLQKLEVQKEFKGTRSEKYKGVIDFVSATSNVENTYNVLVCEQPSTSPANKRKSDAHNTLNGRQKRNRSGGCSLKIRSKGKIDVCEGDASKTKMNILSWLIDKGHLAENEKIFYKWKHDRKRRLRGLVTRGGIRCNCCKTVISLLEFEAHAGSLLCQPWSNICLVSGKSLMECQMDAWSKEWIQREAEFQKVRSGDPDPSDDTCGICADGGCLICCDSCPSTFHPDCLLLKALPEGNWYCPHCICKICAVSGHESMGGNLNLNLHKCNQCGRKYHLECARKNDKHGMVGELLMFCGEACKQVNARLSDMLGLVNPIKDGFSWTLLKRHDDDKRTDFDQRRASAVEGNIKLSMALSILNECFVPLVDPRTGLDLLSQVVYNCGSNFKRLDYNGFYTVILEKGEELISVATLRIHGQNLAEMPFIGTRPMHQRKGMLKRLLKVIEDMLSLLHVEKLIIPAIPDLLKTWTTSFSFQPLQEPLKNEIKSLSIAVFAEATLLQKTIVASAINNNRAVSNSKSKIPEVNDTQSNPDDWIEDLIAADEDIRSWWGSQYDTGVSCVVRHTHEERKYSPAVDPLANQVSSGSSNKLLPTVQLPTQCSTRSSLELSMGSSLGQRSLCLPAYDRPFSQTTTTAPMMGFLRWSQGTQIPNNGTSENSSSVVTFGRPLLFRGVDEVKNGCGDTPQSSHQPFCQQSSEANHSGAPVNL